MDLVGRKIPMKAAQMDRVETSRNLAGKESIEEIILIGITVREVDRKTARR